MTDRGRTYRFFVDDLAGERVTLEPTEAHHARNVLRLTPGAHVELLDGRGGRARGRLVELGRHEAVVAVDDRLPVEPRPGGGVHLAFALPKGKRLDWLLEKATELAAASLQPVVFARSTTGETLRPNKWARMRSHLAGAAKQSGLTWLPDLHEPITLAEYLAGLPPQADLPSEAGEAGGGAATETETRVVGHTVKGAVEPARVVAGSPAGSLFRVLVGPEGGLTDSEVAEATESGFVPVRLGTTVLRVETAVIALLAAVTALSEGRRGDP